MKNKRREYTAQFYKKNHIAFAAALLSSLLTSALNLYIAWVLQQMIDAVSGVPGSFALSALLWFVLSVIARALAPASGDDDWQHGLRADGKNHGAACKFAPAGV